MVMFSYGSGLSATMFSFQIREGQHPFSLSNIATVMNVGGKMKSRHEVSFFLHFIFVLIRTCLILGFVDALWWERKR